MILDKEDSVEIEVKGIKLEQNIESTNSNKWKTRSRNEWKNYRSNADILCVEQKLSKG